MRSAAIERARRIRRKPDAPPVPISRLAPSPRCAALALIRVAGARVANAIWRPRGESLRWAVPTGAGAGAGSASETACVRPDKPTLEISVGAIRHACTGETWESGTSCAAWDEH